MRRYSSRCGFNTQPPEGGWARDGQRETKTDCFNTQPPEGGWVEKLGIDGCMVEFQHTAA